jgi:hypothetical protein
MRERAKHIGIFRMWDVPGEVDSRALWYSYHHNIDLAEVLGDPTIRQNLLMANQKLAMAAAVYPNIDRLVITSQITAPNDSETSYSGALYTTTSVDEFFRSGISNPYRISWKITSSTANGPWGSLILIDASGNMINRALAGTSKLAGVTKIVDFTGRVS